MREVERKIYLVNFQCLFHIMTPFIPLHYSFIFFFSFWDRRAHLKTTFDQYPCNPNNELTLSVITKVRENNVGFATCPRESGGFSSLPNYADKSSFVINRCRRYWWLLQTHIEHIYLPENTRWHSLNKSGQKWFSLISRFFEQENLHFLFSYGPRCNVKVFSLPINP